MPKLIHNRRMILDAYNNRETIGVTIKQLCLIFKVDPKTINNYRHQTDEFLDSNKINKVSFMNKLPDVLIEYVLNSAINNPYFNAKKVKYDIKKNFKCDLTLHQVYLILRFNNITYKKATRITKIKNKTDEEVRHSITNIIDEVNELNNNDEDNVVFTDEVHIDLSDIKNYGWNKKGKKVIYDQEIPRKILNKRITVIASVSRNKKIGYKIIKGNVNGEIFNKYVKNIKKKTNIKNFYLDNARIHHYHKVKETLNDKHVIYGIPYNPQLNIIENFFRSFKANIRNEPLYTRTNYTRMIRKCWNKINNDVMKNTYNHIYEKREGVFN